MSPDPGAEGLDRQDLILSSVLLLMSRYAVASEDGAACPRLAVAIQCHLELLQESFWYNFFGTFARLSP